MSMTTPLQREDYPLVWAWAESMLHVGLVGVLSRLPESQLERLRRSTIKRRELRGKA